MQPFEQLPFFLQLLLSPPASQWAKPRHRCSCGRTTPSPRPGRHRSAGNARVDKMMSKDVQRQFGMEIFNLITLMFQLSNQCLYMSNCNRCYWILIIWKLEVKHQEHVYNQQRNNGLATICAFNVRYWHLPSNLLMLVSAEQVGYGCDYPDWFGLLCWDHLLPGAILHFVVQMQFTDPNQVAGYKIDIEIPMNGMNCVLSCLSSADYIVYCYWGHCPVCVERTIRTVTIPSTL